MYAAAPLTPIHPVLALAVLLALELRRGQAGAYLTFGIYLPTLRDVTTRVLFLLAAR